MRDVIKMRQKRRRSLKGHLDKKRWIRDYFYDVTHDTNSN